MPAPSVRAACLTMVFLCGAAAADGQTLSVNGWTKVHTFPASGERCSPMFYYVPELKRFVLSGGVPTGYGNPSPLHFDTEFFDLENRKWINAYPKGSAWKSESGATDAPPFGAADNQFSADRLGMFEDGYTFDSRTHHQWAYDAADKRLIAYLFNKTLIYDPAERTWKDSGAAPYSQGTRRPLIWGSLCYDPVNKEVLSINGTSAEIGCTPGTCAYSPKDNAWKKVDVADGDAKKRFESGVALRKAAWALLAASRNRFFIAETEAAAKAELSAQADEVRQQAEKLVSALKATKATGVDADRVKTGEKKTTEFVALLKPLAAKLDGAITSALIAEVQNAFLAAEQVELSLAYQPPARGSSQLAFDASTRKIIMFGGNGQDRIYGDTWVYDCKTRTWEQRYPKLAPTPRAGHVLVPLQKSKKVLLAAGYDMAQKEGPVEVWTYDVAANEWHSLFVAPGPRANPQGGSSPWAGAIDEIERLVMVDTGMGPDRNLGRDTWACQIDAGKIDDDLTQKIGVPPGGMQMSMEPQAWETGITPDAAKVADFYKNLKANEWTMLPHVARELTHPRIWSSMAYDSDSQQFLYWGGGHVVRTTTDVGHYSVRSNTWTISYAPELEFEPYGGHMVKSERTFRDRPQIPIHAYQAYAYDPPSGLMIYLQYPYNVAKREWEAEVFPFPSCGSLETVLESTPNGLVAWDANGLFRFEAKSRSYQKLPVTGQQPGAAYNDLTMLCYDSKRDCLWLSTWGREGIMKYDLKSGQCEVVQKTPPKSLGNGEGLKSLFWRDEVYLPEADLIAFAWPVDGKTFFFDPQSLKFYSCKLPFLEGGKARDFRGNVSESAMTYDAKLKAILLPEINGNLDYIGMFAARIDRKALELTEITQ